MGKFVVHDNLPKHLAQGMFAKPGSYGTPLLSLSSLHTSLFLYHTANIGQTDMIMRYSSLTPKLLPDNLPAPRGIGMKIFGVEGEKIWGEDKKTQDWTFNNYSVLELRTPKVTYEIADSLEKNWNDLPTFAKEQSERVDADVATMGGGLPRQHSTSFSFASCSVSERRDLLT